MSNIVPVFMVENLTKKSVNDIAWLQSSGMFIRQPILVGTSEDLSIPENLNTTFINVPIPCQEIEKVLFAALTAVKIEGCTTIALLAADRNHKSDPNLIRVLRRHISGSPDPARFIGPTCTDYLFRTCDLLAAINRRLPKLFEYQTNYEKKKSEQAYSPFFRKYGSLDKEIVSCMDGMHNYHYRSDLREFYTPWTSQKISLYG